MINTVAGNGNFSFSGDGGAALNAQIASPYGIAFDAAGNLYFGDFGNNVIRKVNTSKNISTVAGNGGYGYTGDGAAATGATFYSPPDIAIDGSGNMYIVDAGNNVVRKVNSAGVISTFAGNGTAGYTGDGAAATAAELSGPTGIAVDASGNVYIADNGNVVIRKVNTSGIISTIAGDGTPGYSGDGTSAVTAEIDNPYGIAVDGSGNVFIGDYNNSVIRKVNTSGIISTYAGTGSYGYSGDGGAATAATINSPLLIKCDGSGNLFITDYGNNAIRKINSLQIITTIAGNGHGGFSGDGGAATAAELYLPLGVALDASGNVYISDGSNDRIRKVNTSGVISTLVGGLGNGNPATAVSFGALNSVVDGSGNIYVVDADNNRISKINTSGVNTTIAGNGTYGYTGDGGPASAAQLTYPAGIALDASGNIYIADEYNATIRKVNTSGTISTIAGVDTSGYTGDGGPATSARLSYPASVAIDGGGNLYIADYGNNVIRKVNNSGVISTFAGNGAIGYSGDGGFAVTAELNGPTGIAADASGNVFIADYNNNAIRKVNTSGIISTIAGGGPSGYTGDLGAATAAQLNLPYGVAVDGSGNVFIADDGNNVIRKINALGIISTLAGNGTGGFLGDGGPATASEMSGPTGVAIDGSGKVYVSDYNNYRIRKILSSNLPAITGTMVICASSTTALTDATLGGTWTSATSGVATVVSGTGVVTGVSAGTATIIYALSGNTVTTTVTVNPLPNAGAITGVSAVCLGSTVSLTDAATGGVWSSSNTTASVSGGMVNGLVAGIDTIKYTVINGCGTAITTKSVSVNPLPTSGSVTGLSVVCVSSTIALTDATAGGVWSSGGAAATVSGGVVSGVSAGTATISYAVTTSCGTSVATKIITVNPLPNSGTITGVSSVCVGSSIGLSDASSGGIWGASNTTASVSAGSVTGAIAGTDTISYAVTNSCGTATATKVITINPLPTAGSITGASSVCAGSGTTLSDAAGGGIWSSSNTTANVAGGFVTGVSAGTATISYVVTTVCGTATATAPMTINALPTGGTITGASTVCQGSSIVLTDAVSGGVWSSTNTNVSVSGGVVTGVSPGTTTVKYAVTTSCGTATALKSLTINPLPAVLAISGGSNVCVGATLTLTDATGGGAWASSNTSASVTGGTVSGLVAGTDTIKYGVTNGCGTTTMSKAITVIPAVPSAGTITGATLVCVGATAVLTDATPGGVWSSSGGATVSGGVVTGVSAGSATISYVISATCGTATATTTITVDPLLSAGTITGSSSVCAGSSIALTDATAGGAWGSSNANATVAAGLVGGVTAGIDTISYSVTSACGTATATKAVTINPAPAVSSITGLTSVCAGATIPLTDATSGGVWSSSNTSATVSGGTVTGVTAGTSVISYAVTITCGTATATTTVTTDPLPSAGTITGSSSVCIGSSITLTDAASGGVWSSSNTAVSVGVGVVTGVVTGTSTITYSVTSSCGTATSTKTLTINPLPTVSVVTGSSSVCQAATITLTDASGGGAWSSSNTSASVSGGVVTGLAAGTDTINYVVTTGCGSATASKAITVNPSPFAGTITGPTGVCVGSSIALTDATGGGTWSSSNTNASVSGGLVSGLVAGSDVIKYSVTNGCGTATATQSVIINPLPTSILGASVVCAGADITLTDASTGGSWSSPSYTAIVLVGTGGTVSGVSAGTAIITYELLTGCTTVRTVTVDPVPLAYTVTGGGSFCAGGSGIHIGLTNSDAGVKYQLYVGSLLSGAAMSGTGFSIDFGPETAGGVYTVQATDSMTTCSSDMLSSARITVNPVPAAITGVTSVCEGSSVTLSDGSAGGKWSSSNTDIATVAGGLVAGVYAGTATIMYSYPTGCFVSASVTVNPLPSPIGGASEVCKGLGTTLTDGGSGTWTSGSPSVATIVSGTGALTGVNAGTSLITYKLGTGCKTTTVFTVDPLPLAIKGTTTVCVNASTDLSDATTGGSWLTASGLISITSPGVIAGVTAGSAIVTYELPTGCLVTTTVTVDPLAAPGTISGGTSVCIDSALVLNDTASGGTWLASNGFASVSTTGVVSGVAAGVDTIMYAVTNSCGTQNASKVVTVVNCKLSVPVTAGAGARLNVYPNPNAGMFTVDLSSPLDEQVSIVITNVVGEKVGEVMGVTNRPVGITLNVPAGMYLLSGTTAHGKYVAKVTVD